MARLALTGSIVLIAIAAVAIGWTLLLRPEKPELSPHRIAVFPFTVRGSEQHHFLSEGMVDLLSMSLDRAGNIRSANPHAVLGLLKQEDGLQVDRRTGRHVAYKMGAGLHLLGDILVFGERMQINAFLYETGRGGKSFESVTVEGEADRVTELVDELALNLLTNRLGKSGDQRLKFSSGITSSLPALKEFLVGESLYRTGQYDPAIEAHLRAVEKDPAFAFAYFRLVGIAGYSVRWVDTWNDAWEKLQAHKDRLPERIRRLVQAELVIQSGEVEEGIGLLYNLIGESPSDLEASYRLGEVQMFYGRWQGIWLEEAREAFERILFYDPGHAPTVSWLWVLAAMQGKHEECLEWSERGLELEPDGDYTMANRANIAFSRGDDNAREEILNELRQYEEDRLKFVIEVLPLCTGNLLGAERITELLTESSRSPETRGNGHIFKAHLKVARGQWRDARSELDAAETFLPFAAEPRAIFALSPLVETSRSELEGIREDLSQLDYSPIWAPVYRGALQGLLSARLGEVESALQHAMDLEEIGTPPPGKPRNGWRALSWDLSQVVRAEVSRLTGDLQEALALIEAIPPESYWQRTNPPDLLVSGAFKRYLRASLLEELGRHDEALHWYRSQGMVSGNEVVFLAPSFLRMAESHEKSGNSEQAIMEYYRFIGLWKDCDPEYRPLLEKAKTRLRRLQDQAG